MTAEQDGNKETQKRSVNVPLEIVTQVLQGTLCPTPECGGEMQTYISFKNDQIVTRIACRKSCGAVVDLPTVEVSYSLIPQATQND